MEYSPITPEDAQARNDYEALVEAMLNEPNLNYRIARLMADRDKWVRRHRDMVDANTQLAKECAQAIFAKQDREESITALQRKVIELQGYVNALKAHLNRVN